MNQSDMYQVDPLAAFLAMNSSPASPSRGLSHASPVGGPMSAPPTGESTGPSRILLMRQLSEGLSARLRLSVDAMFNNVEDSLISISDQDPRGASARYLMSALVECRTKRSYVQDRFSVTLRNFANDNFVDEVTTNFSRPSPLSLMNPTELEENLAIDAMVDRSTQNLAAPLQLLTQRIEHLHATSFRRARENDNVGNPFTPRRVANAFCSAASALNIELEPRLIIYKLFERQVLAALEPAYAEMNSRLVAAGVLPSLVLRPKEAAPNSAPAMFTPQSDLKLPIEAPDRRKEDRRHADREKSVLPRPAELLSAIHSLLMRPQSSGDEEVRRHAGPSPRGTPAATVMDKTLMRLCSRPNANRPMPPPRLLAAQILAAVGSAPGAIPPTPEQAATIDLVGRVFETLSSRAALSDRARPLVQALLLPIMRANLQDPGLLASERHPLYQLLDLVSERAIGWCPSVDPDDGVLSKLRASLDQIASFTRLEDAERTIAELRSELEFQRTRATRAENRVIEAATGRDRLWMARSAARSSLSDISKSFRINKAHSSPGASNSLSNWAQHLIDSVWSKYLVLLWLRSDRARTHEQGREFAKWLVECSLVRHASPEMHVLASHAGEMKAMLRDGLLAIGTHEEEVKLKLGELDLFLSYRLGLAAAPDFLDVEYPEDSYAVMLGASVEEQPLPENIDPKLLSMVLSARPGTWFEFDQENAPQQRARLSWVSPHSGRLLFVNQNGAKVSESRPEDISSSVERGRARIVGEAPILPHALAQVLANLRAEVADRPVAMSA
jgi:hypothetical protein